MLKLLFQELGLWVPLRAHHFLMLHTLTVGLREKEFLADSVYYFIRPHLCKLRDEASKLTHVDLLLITVYLHLLATMFPEAQASFYKWLKYLHWQLFFLICSPVSLLKWMPHQYKRPTFLHLESTPRLFMLRWEKTEL